MRFHTLLFLCFICLNAFSNESITTTINNITYQCTPKDSSEEVIKYYCKCREISAYMYLLNFYKYEVISGEESYIRNLATFYTSDADCRHHMREFVECRP